QDLPTIRADRNENPTEAISDNDDMSASVVEWSQSPPTQQRRHKLASIKSDDDTSSVAAESQDLSSSPPLLNHQITTLPRSSSPVDFQRHGLLADPESSAQMPGSRNPSPGITLQEPSVNKEAHKEVGPRPEDI